jgi:hypothetical protein
MLWWLLGILVAGAGYFVGYYVIGNEFVIRLWELGFSLLPIEDINVLHPVEDFLRIFFGSFCAILAVNFYMLTYVTLHKH